MAAIKGIDIIRRWVIQTTVKDQSKQGGVMITLPRNDFVDLNTSITAERLMRNGIDPNSITSVNQVDNIINQLNKPRVISQDNPEFKGIMSRMMNKNAEIFNLQKEKLDPNLPIIGGTQQGKKINREFFERDAEGKDDIRKGIAKEVQEVQQRIDSGVATTVEKMLAMEPIDAMKEANLVIGRKGPYKNLTQEDAKKILEDTEDHIFEKNVDLDPEDMFADGGRIGFFMGSKLPKGLAALREMLNFMSKQSDQVKNPSDVLKMINRKSLNVSLEDPRLQGKINKEGILASDMIKNFQSKMDEDRVQLVKDMLSAAKNIKKADTSQIKLKNEMIEDMIKKGVDREMAEEMATTMSRLARNVAGKFTDTPKLTDEGILELENILKNMETGGKKKRDLNADGGRIGFKKGMTRRQFLEIMGGIGAAGVAAKTGILKLLGKEGARQVTKQTITTPPIAGKPAWFDMLVNKVIAEGKDVTKQFATKEREIVHKLEVDNFEEVRVTQDLETGAIRVEYESPDNVGEGAIDLVFKKGETTEDGVKIADEFYAVEPEPRVVNFDGDIEFDGENLVDNVEDLMSPTTRLKEISLGKKQTLKEYIDTKKKKDAVKKINEDKMAQINYVEKKYGPAPDVGDYGGGKDETIEVFENYQGKASGGIARMLGE